MKGGVAHSFVWGIWGEYPGGRSWRHLGQWESGKVGKCEIKIAREIERLEREKYLASLAISYSRDLMECFCHCWNIYGLNLGLVEVLEYI